MKTVILYYSKTGFTRRYAQWLQEELGCPCVPYEKRRGVDFSQYGTVVFGGRLHAGLIQGAPWLFRQKDLKGRRLALFFTGAMPPEPQAINKAIQQNIPPEWRDAARAFYLWGGLNYEKMGLADRFLMWGFRRMLAAKKDPTPEEREAARMAAQSYDKASREQLEPLLAYLRDQ